MQLLPNFSILDPILSTCKPTHPYITPYTQPQLRTPCDKYVHPVQPLTHSLIPYTPSPKLHTQPCIHSFNPAHPTQSMYAQSQNPHQHYHDYTHFQPRTPIPKPWISSPNHAQPTPTLYTHLLSLARDGKYLMTSSIRLSVSYVSFSRCNTLVYFLETLQVRAVYHGVKYMFRN